MIGSVNNNLVEFRFDDRRVALVLDDNLAIVVGSVLSALVGLLLDSADFSFGEVFRADILAAEVEEVVSGEDSLVVSVGVDTLVGNDEGVLQSGEALVVEEVGDEGESIRLGEVVEDDWEAGLFGVEVDVEDLDEDVCADDWEMLLGVVGVDELVEVHVPVAIVDFRTVCLEELEGEGVEEGEQSGGVGSLICEFLDEVADQWHRHAGQSSHVVGRDSEESAELLVEDLSEELFVDSLVCSGDEVVDQMEVGSRLLGLGQLWQSVLLNVGIDEVVDGLAGVEHRHAQKSH